jgi:hypothetical protein
MAPPEAINSIQPPAGLQSLKAPSNYFGQLQIDNRNNVLNAGNMQITSNSTISSYALNINKQGNTAALTIDNLGNINTNGVINAQGLIIGNALFTTITCNGAASFANNQASIGEDGHFETTFTNYIKPNELRNSSATTGDFIATSTSKYLTTQMYVDEGLWYLQKQLNIITNLDSTSLESFNNVFNLIKTLAGNDYVNALDGIVNTTNEIKISVSDAIETSQNTIVINCTISVWGNGCAPLPIPNAIISPVSGNNTNNSNNNSNYVFDGWFFQNMVNVPAASTTTTNSITWTIPPSGSNMKFSDIQNMYMNVFAVSSESLPFITVNTQSTNSTGNIIQNTIKYTFTSTTPSLTSNTSYCLYTGSRPLNIYDVTYLQGMLASNNNTNVQPRPTDKVLSFTISTDNTQPLNSVSFILSSFNIKQISGTTQFLFSNASVSSNFMYNMFLRLNSDMTPITSTQYGEPIIVNEVNNGGTYFESYKDMYLNNYN